MAEVKSILAEIAAERLAEMWADWERYDSRLISYEKELLATGD